jgi:CubicO group peptidase (beta-lactamase class C family)
MSTTRRSVLGLLGLSGAAVVASGAGRADAGTRHGRIPDDLRPGGALDLFVEEQADRGAFSGSLLLAYRGRTVLARSYGMADVARSISNGPLTRFALASVTKLFTAVAVAQLAQEGKIRYGQKIGTFLDGFSAEVADNVTIHHLLTHTSGLGDPFDMPGALETARTWTSIDQVMDGMTEFIRQSPLAFSPGAGFRYSNAGYHLLGVIVARVSGKSYHDYVRDHVFRPAGMVNSDFHTRPEWKIDSRIAHPYATQPSGGRVDIVDERLFIGTPAGDAFSTTGDMVRFTQALLGETLLNSAYRGIMLGGKVLPGQAGSPSNQPPPGGDPAQVIFQCYGPMSALVHNQWVTGHSGGSQGISTDVQMYVDTDWVSVILSNFDYGMNVPPVFVQARESIIGSTSSAGR